VTIHGYTHVRTIRHTDANTHKKICVFLCGYLIHYPRQCDTRMYLICTVLGVCVFDNEGPRVETDDCVVVDVEGNAAFFTYFDEGFIETKVDLTPTINLVAQQQKRRLTRDEEEIIKNILNNDTRKKNTVVVRAPPDSTWTSYELTRADLQCLRPAKKLNDQVINFYFDLLTARNQRMAHAIAPVETRITSCFYHTFFTPMFNQGYEYKSVKKWSASKGIEIVKYDKIFVPVHVNNNHWCLLVVNFKRRRIEYYDSYRSSTSTDGGHRIMHYMKKYIQDENMTYNQKKVDFSNWTMYIPPRLPQQDNETDCGVFMCMFANYLALGLDLAFTCRDMRYFRRRIALSIQKLYIE
jgi:sentrin-specific protease 1